MSIITIRNTVKLGLVLIVLGIATFLIVTNLPHRNVQGSKTDTQITLEQVYSEYKSDPNAADEKYLDESGDSNIMEVSGVFVSTNKNLNGQIILILGSKTESVKLRCTLISDFNEEINNLIQGDNITIKGVIRSGIYYDEALQRYGDFVFNDCDIK
ncbi:MAG TPA: hypothetical protein DCE78_06335 [Bacteroidetes bacterium]|nr:hypothetical protein [Bacteroidota bacterium]